MNTTDLMVEQTEQLIQCLDTAHTVETRAHAELSQTLRELDAALRALVTAVIV